MSKPKVPSQKAIAELETAALRIAGVIPAQRLWERCLSPADRQRLGGDFEKAYADGGTASMWVRLRGVSRQRAVVDLARLLEFLRENDYKWLLGEIGEIVDVDEALERAIANGGFVLVEQPRRAYWHGEQIDLDWIKNSVLWELVWELARSAKAGRAVDRLSFGHESHCDVVTKRKSDSQHVRAFRWTSPT